MERNRGSIDYMLMITGDGLVRSGEMRSSQEKRWLDYARAYRNFLGVRTDFQNADDQERHTEDLSRLLTGTHELATGEGVPEKVLKVAEAIAVRDSIKRQVGRGV